MSVSKGFHCSCKVYSHVYYFLSLGNSVYEMMDAVVNKQAEYLLMDVYNAGNYNDMLKNKNLKIKKIIEVHNNNFSLK